MDTGAFVGQSVAQVTIRPRRLAYLVRAGRADDVRKAIRYAFTEWGGHSHPIAPVRKGLRIDPATWQFLENIRPEVVIDYAGVDQALTVEISQRLGSQVIPERNLPFGEPGIHNLVTITPGSLRARTLFEIPERASMWHEAAVGSFAKSPELDRLWMETGGLRTTIASPVDLIDAQLDVPSPIWTLKQHFQTYWSQVFGGPVIVYCDSERSLSRLVRFWNVRALAAGTDINVIWTPVADLAEPGVQERIKALCMNRMHSTPDLLLLGPDTTSLNAAASSMGFTLHESSKSRQRWSSESRDLSKEPLSFWSGIDPRGFVLGERRVGNRVAVPVTIAKPITTVQVESPIQFNPSISGRLRIEIDELSVVDWPRRASVAKLIHPDADWTAGGLGLVYAPAQRYRIDLAVPDASSVVDMCLGDGGWSWTLSDKGRYAHALVGSVPGRQTIEALHDRLVLAVIRELTSLTSRKAEQAMHGLSLPTGGENSEAISAILLSLGRKWLTSGEITSRLSTTSERVKRREVVLALNRLLDGHLVVRSYRFRCANCGLISHVPLDQATDFIRCDGCAADAALKGADGEPELEYGLNSLLDRASDQDCHIHLLVQDWIKRNLSGVWSVPGANLISRDASIREVDVLALSHSQLILAEVKTAAAGFSDAIVDSVAAMAATTTADHLVLAALDDWIDGHRNHVRELAKAKVSEVTVIGLADILQT